MKNRNSAPWTALDPEQWKLVDHRDYHWLLHELHSVTPRIGTMVIGGFPGYTMGICIHAGV
jgi:hypothetical protein